MMQEIFKAFRKATRGQAANQIGNFAIGTIIAIFVVATIFSSLDTSGLSTAAQTSVNQVFSYTLTAMGLVGILLIVLAASYIQRAGM